MAGRNRLLGLLRFEESIGLEEFFVMVDEGGHVLRLHDDLIFLLWRSRVFIDVQVFVASMQGGPAGGGDAHHSGGGRENIDAQLTTKRGFTRLHHIRWSR